MKIQKVDNTQENRNNHALWLTYTNEGTVNLQVAMPYHDSLLSRYFDDTKKLRIKRKHNISMLHGANSHSLH